MPPRKLLDTEIGNFIVELNTMSTIAGGKYTRYNQKRFFVMSVAIEEDGTTAVPEEALEGSVGYTTHLTGRYTQFVAQDGYWIPSSGSGGDLSDIDGGSFSTVYDAGGYDGGGF